MSDNAQPRPADGAVVTRFAPSPTGHLHIGGARTALFNWLFARGRGGKFLLRIEDTDRARHNEAAVDAILDGLSWLGLDWDGEPVSQYARRERHAAIAHEMLAAGKAYKCYLAGDELAAARDAAREAGERFESPWREADPASAPEGAPHAVRFRAPREGKTIVRDAVQGDVEFPNSALDDLVILRSGEGAEAGAPTYNLAVVVDDHDMGVTHVIRGDDHLNNAARQQQIYDALGWPAPVFAHIPLIHGPDGAKLSKRHGALGVEHYRNDGFIAPGLASYLLRLGWAHGDEEIIPLDKARAWFDLAGVNKSPARLDLDKLRNTNAHFIAEMADDAFAEAARPFLERADVPLDEKRWARFARAAPALKTRCATLADAPETAKFLLLERPLEISGKAEKPLRKEGAKELIGEVAERLAATERWDDPASLERALNEFVEERDLGFGAIGAPLRAALTAGAPAPSMGEVLFALGRDEALARIADQTA